jgi:cystathionine beta-lyase/cystathionine gamma-synthase
MQKFDLSTTTTHPQLHLPEAHNSSFLASISETVSFSLPSVEEWENTLLGGRAAWCYHSDANPTVKSLESLLAKIQRREDCYVTSTGKSAIAAALVSILNQEDSVIILREGYKSTQLFCRGTLSRFGIRTILISVDEIDSLELILKKYKPRLLILESPTNPMTRIVDLRVCVELARRYSTLTMLDISQAGIHQYQDVPADIVALSLSKYTSGVGDVMGGAVLGAKALVNQIRNSNCWNCDALAASSASLLLRGMHTYSLRIERQNQNAEKIANFLEGHPKVRRVLYPGLRSHPDYQIAKKQMSDFGSVIAFDLEGQTKPEGTSTAVRQFLNALRIFKLAFGTGFTQSIAAPAWLFYARSFPEQQLGASTIGDTTIRLSIGIENASDLIEDLKQAFRKLT